MADFLLVHGANATADEWERVVPALQADTRVGTIVAPDMPGRRANRPGEYRTIRLDDYLSTLLTALEQHDLRDVVLVGHSGGGMCLQAAAAATPERVRRLVFLSAVVPDNGRSFLDLQPWPLRLFLRSASGPFRARQRGMKPFSPFVNWALGHDLLPEDRAVLSTIVPEPLALMIGRLTWPAERVHAPATYVRTTKDRVLRPKVQLRMAKKLPGVELINLPTGHAYPVLHPQRLVEILLQYT